MMVPFQEPLKEFYKEPVTASGLSSDIEPLNTKPSKVVAVPGASLRAPIRDQDLYYTVL